MILTKVVNRSKFHLRRFINTKLRLIGCPSCYGQTLMGADESPQLLIDNGLLEVINESNYNLEELQLLDFTDIDSLNNNNSSSDNSGDSSGCDSSNNSSSSSDSITN